MQMPQDVRCLVTLKNFIVHAIGLQDTKRVKKIYFGYPMELYVNRYKWGSSEAGGDTQSPGPVSRNIRRMMVNLNDSLGSSNEGFNYGGGSVALKGMSQEEFESHEGFMVGDPMTESFHLDPDQEDGRDVDDEKLISFRISQLALAQPAISQPYECPAHFSALNLDAMNSEFSLGQGGLDDNTTAEFDVGQQFENKEEVL
ncbi:hypothetical protein PIB30_013210 [Stylosanthes scabra]|uniref:Uncharacterized protein n=1 Tax=Stylosanthes scabra TaxID=79078 RepID=A0ABU6Q6H1_9FABA|nr:hypothetical protein [Stylosanthes scabra]